MSDPTGFLIFCLIALGLLSAGSLWGAFRVMRVTRLIENLPTSKIRSAPQGYVELVGVTQWLPGQRVTSPLSGTECVWWSYDIKKRVNDPRSRVVWQTVDQRIGHEPFLLKDDTGQCVVNPLGAELLGAELKAGGDQREWYGTTAWPKPGSSGSATNTATGPEPIYKYQERLIRRDVPLHVLGDFRTKQAAPDAPGVAATEELHTVSKPSQGDKPFILSTRTQDELSDGSRGLAWFLFACFLVTGALLAWAIEGLWHGRPAQQILFGFLAAFGVVLFIIMSLGPLATGIRILLGLPVASPGQPPARKSRWAALPLFVFALLMGALTGFLCYWAAQEAGLQAAAFSWGNSTVD